MLARFVNRSWWSGGKPENIQKRWEENAGYCKGDGLEIIMLVANLRPLVDPGTS